jgi:hypothetical protein
LPDPPATGTLGARGDAPSSDFFRRPPWESVMKTSIYVETSIVSYLTAWPQRDLVRAAHQEVTREW